MADLATLRDLRDRLANATGPDRRLDHDLMALSYVKGERSIGTMEDDGTGWRPCTDFVWIDPETNRWKTTARDGFEYTASIDAAVALCTRVLPGTSLIMRRGYLGDYAACNVGKEPGGFRARETWGNAERPDNELALAICRAIVEGLIAQEEANG